MSATFTIHRRLPGLNEIIAASKGHWGRYAKMKKENMNYIMEEITSQHSVPETPLNEIVISILWVEENRRRDPDNIFAGVKFILDAMVHAGVVKNDTGRQIRGISNRLEYDSVSRVDVTVNPVQ